MSHLPTPVKGVFHVGAYLVLWTRREAERAWLFVKTAHKYGAGCTVPLSDLIATRPECPFVPGVHETWPIGHVVEISPEDTKRLHDKLKKYFVEDNPPEDEGGMEDAP
jgi:hypothetical protein